MKMKKILNNISDYEKSYTFYYGFVGLLIGMAVDFLIHFQWNGIFI